jgi:hypothetical protein
MSAPQIPAPGIQPEQDMRFCKRSSTDFSQKKAPKGLYLVLPLGDKGGAEPQVIMPLGQPHRKTHRLHL